LDVLQNIQGFITASGERLFRGKEHGHNIRKKPSA